MQDRFKFRAWDTFVEKYLKDDDVFKITDGILDNLYELLIEDNRHFILGKHDFIFEQCTGLRDENGKLIYEGDILSIEYQSNCDSPKINIYEGNHVEYNENQAAYIATTGKQFISLSGLAENTDLEVIGNIHENPELLG